MILLIIAFCLVAAWVIVCRFMRVMGSINNRLK